MNMREPESQATFDGSFSLRDRNYSGACAAELIEKKTQAELRMCRVEAAIVANEWLLTHGYFNGEFEQSVTVDNNTKTVDCKVVLTCYGRPDRIDVAAMLNEIRSVLLLMDGLAEQWGDEGVFRRCRDRLRKLTQGAT